MRRLTQIKAITNALFGITNMKQLLSLLLTLSLSIPANADCSKPVIPLDQGAPAPCKGFLFSPAQEQKMYLLNENASLLQQQLDNTTTMNNSYKKSLSDFQVILKEEADKSELWRKAAEDSTQKLIKETDSRGSRDFWMVVLGVAMTVGAGFALGQVHTK
jgi:hypothetical protein